MRRRKRRPVEVTEAGPFRGGSELAAPASDHSLRLSLEATLRQLDPRRRSAFVLYAIEGFTHREIGEILGVPEGTSKALLFEARRDLQHRLAGAAAGASA
jgi:RNA polymerase sigma-70 factor (ECF subfamily)